MKSALHIIDMSPVVYAGTYNKRSLIPAPEPVMTADGYRERYIPTGGTSMLFNILAQYMGTGDIVFVADRSPTIKREIRSSYKSQKSPNQLVQVSKEVAEYILTDCGFDVLYRDGYEADDVIANLVEQYYKQYDCIFVHTGDSDLYILVDDKVSILPTSSVAKLVHMDNYSTVCKAGVTTMYNTVVWNKFISGDSGKDIPALSAAAVEKIRKTIRVTPEYAKHFGNWRYMRSLFEKVLPDFFDRLQLFYPLPIDEPLPIGGQGDKGRIREWASLIRNKKIPAKEPHLDKEVDELFERGLYLES